MMEEDVVAVTGLKKSFDGKLVVNNVSLQIKKGEIFGFLGPNGSGKTTIMRMLCGLITPDAGSGHCLGYNILQDSYIIKKFVGYVPQAFSLYQDLTVKENLEFIARIYQVTSYKNRVQQMMTRLHLTPYQQQLSGSLSGGWKQRVSLAAALIHNPRLLLLDEPTAGVDPKARRDFWNEIHQLTTEGISVLVSTHYIDEAERCNRLAYIAYGDLLVQGTLEEVTAHPSLFTWSVTGNNLAKLAALLEKESVIEQVSLLGNELRVCSREASFGKMAARKYVHYNWKPSHPSLEEVFIDLVNK